MRTLTASFLFILTINTGFAQTGNFTFTNYSTVQGLADNNVQSLIQDSRGFLWAGTLEGLSRFDGKTFKNFYASRTDSIVKANDFSYIYEYKKGHLVMNNYNRVICFNTFTEKFYLPDFHITSYVSILRSPGQPGYSLAAINKCYIINKDLTTIDSIVALPEKNISSYLSPYYLPGRKEMLVQYNNKNYLYTAAEKKYELLPVSFTAPGNTHQAFFRYYDPSTGELYFADYLLGLFRYSLATQKTEKLTRDSNGVPYTNGFVFQVFPQKNNELWLLTEGGITILDRKKNTVHFITSVEGKYNSLANNACYSNCTDADGNLWLGTANGISKLNAGSLVIRNWADGFATTRNAGLMSVVKGADQHIYASVYNGKAYRLDLSTGKVTAWPHPLNQFNWNLFVKGDEVIRTGAGNQLLSYNTTTGQYKTLDFLKPFYPHVELIVLGFVHSNGDEWYCANRGGGFVRKLAGTDIYKIYRKNDGINTFSSSYYTSYTEDNQGDLWFGVNKSALLLHWDLQTGKFDEIDFAHFPGLENIAHTGINSVTHDADDNIWIAFNGSGLIKYLPKEKKAVRYSINDGLPTNFISGLAFDNSNRLWLNTFKGLSCFIVNENKFINFKKEDGLPDDYFSDYCIYFDKAGNKMWTGANSALVEFTPEELLKLGKERFPVFVDEIFVNSKRYTDTLLNDLSLKAAENNLQFHFIGIDFNKGKDIEYSFKLEGADNDWISTGGNQSASYTSLSPGTYSFKVRARHKGDNKWNEITIPLRFTIATPWFKTWWFRLLVILFTGLLLWYIIRAWYLRKIEKEKAILEKKQAIEMERTRIATDMHDDFGASLSRIKFLSEKLQLHKADTQGEKLDLEKISLYSDEMAEKMNEIVWALNQRYDSLGDLVSFCRSYASEYLQDKNIKLHFTSDEPGEEKIQGEVRRNIFLVIKEALRNIVKHAAATSVSLSFKRSADRKHIMVTIYDNGKGINMDGIRPFANGLENMKKRMADINGSFSIENKEGTAITITAPV